MKPHSHLKELNELIQQGQRAKAREVLEKLNPSKVGREEAIAIATLARRAELADLALLVLRRYVRPSQRKTASATDAEKAEYAASLAYLGLANEALTLLSEINAEKTPQALLFQTFAHVSRWEYGATIPLLKKYIASPGIADYQRLVGKVNLAAALNYQHEHKEFKQLIADIIKEAEAGGHRLLHGNALELAAQNALNEKKWKEAETFLSKAEALLKESGGLDAFFARKWQSVVAFWQDPKSPQVRADWEATKQEATKLQHWETVRDFDRIEAIVTRNPQTLTHLFYGTPFKAFRERVLADYGGKQEIAENYVWTRAPSDSVWIDVFTGTSSGKAKPLKAGQVPHRLLMTLTSDFYRPFTLQVLYARLFPGEFYNPDVSSSRIHQGILALKKWLTQNKIPLSIEQRDGAYSLGWEGPCSIRVHFAEEPLDGDTLLIARLRRWKSEFTVRETSKFLEVSLMTALRLLQTAQERKVLLRVGKGRATRYHFPAVASEIHKTK